MTQKAKERAAEKVVSLLDDMSFEPEGTPTLPCKFSSGAYKMKPVPANLSFFIKSAYVGKKGGLNFVLSPEDAQDWEQAECTPQKLETVFPLVGPALKEKLNDDMYSENFEVLFSEMVEMELRLIAEEEALEAKKYETNPTFGMF